MNRGEARYKKLQNMRQGAKVNSSGREGQLLPDHHAELLTPNQLILGYAEKQFTLLLDCPGRTMGCILMDRRAET